MKPLHMLILLLLIILIVINGYFSAVEIALVSVKKFKVQEEADKGNKRAIQVMDFLQTPEEYLSTIQVGMTLIGLVQGLYAGILSDKYLQPSMLHWGFSPAVSHIVSVVFGIGFITYITIIIGELIPKSLAIQSPMRISLWSAPTFRMFSFIAYPFVLILTGSTRFLLRLFRIGKSENQKLSDNDLKSLLSTAYRQGVLEKEELQLHENIFNFYDITVGKLMTPLQKVITLKTGMSNTDASKIIRDSAHNYFPVVANDRKVAGFLSAKEYLLNPDKPIQEFTHAACLLTVDKKASDVLLKFKERSQNFAVVVSAAGELQGLVTMHDIGEVLIGKLP